MLKNLFAPTDMTKGSVWKGIVLFTLPMLVGNIAQQLYSTVDSIVVGHYVGDNALASVGSAAPLFNMLLVLFVGISAGVGIMVSQYFGAKAREELSEEIKECEILYLYGGVFQNNELFRKSFIDDIKEFHSDLKIEMLTLQPEEGALKIAREMQ